MDWMSAWWAALPMFEKILWCIAIPSTVLTILQVILEIFGVSGHDVDIQDGSTHIDFTDIAHAHDGLFHGFQWFSVKGLIIFFTVFSWLTIGLTRSGLALFLAIIIAIIFGLICMFLFAWIFLFIARMSESGNVKTENALYKYGRVYLKIPAHREGKGKVTVTIQGVSRELFALTDGEEIPTGAQIQVIDIINDETLLVAIEE